MTDQTITGDGSQASERDHVVAEIRSRVERFVWDCDPDLVIGQDAAREIAALQRLVPDPFADLEAIQAAAVLAWLRYLALPAGSTGLDRAALGAAAGLFHPIYARSPSAVPVPLHSLLAELAQQPSQMLSVCEKWCTDYDDRKDALLAAEIDMLPANDRVRSVALANLALRLSLHPAGLPRVNVAIGALHRSIAVARDGDRDQAARLSNLAGLLEDRYRSTGQLADLDEAVTLLRRAVELRDPERGASHQSNLSGALQLRYLSQGNKDDLRLALSAARQATQDAPGTAMFLHNLAGALHLEYERTRDPANLTAALDTQAKALDAAPLGSKGRAEILSMLGVFRRASYDLTGDDVQLETSIAIQRQAIEETPADDPIGRAIRLSCLATAVGRRYERTEELADLNMQVRLQAEALRTVPAHHPQIGLFLTNYGGALRARYERTGKPDDLTEAVDKICAAFGVTRPENPAIYMYGVNAGAVLILKYRATRDPAALDSAVGMLQIVVDDEEPGADRRTLAAALAVLAAALADRSDRDGALDDALAAQKACLQAIELTTDDDPRHGGYAATLASILRSRARRTRDPADRAAAMAALRAAAADPAAPIVSRIGAAQVAASMCAESGQWRPASDLLAEAVMLLPLTVPRQLLRTDQEHWLSRFTDLAADAAACAIAAREYDRAVQCLELGRGVLLAQALSLRTAVEDLHAAAPDLAARFERIRAELDAPEVQLPHLHADRPGDLLSAFDAERGIADRRRRLVSELGQLTGQIRGLPGFADFLQIPSAGDLRSAADQGPLVLINVSSYRSDALILTPAGVRPAVPLTEACPQTVADNVVAFATAVENAAQPDDDSFAHTQEVVAQTLAWLWAAVAEPVLADLGYTQTPGPDEPWPRVWWSPTGLLSYLPLHAACAQDPDSPAVLERVISSYTPTVYALLESRRRQRPPDPAQTMLVIAMPQTPQTADLPGAAREAGLLATRYAAAEILGTWPQAMAAATRQSVIAALPRHAFAHFACHGTCDMAEPSASLLQVSDHATDPLTVADIASLNLDRAQFAYLSACETARTGPELTNEAQHLVTAFSLAGYPHVIGTLWKIDDSAGYSIAQQLYADLASDGQHIQAGRAAHALHSAIRDMRERWPDTPTSWAAHIHAGA